MRTRSIAITQLLALGLYATATLGFPASAYDNPYRRVPATGEAVRLSGAAGGASQAWAYYDRDRLESFLRLTINAASDNRRYAEMESEIGKFSRNVIKLKNGTRATIETVEPFSYRGKTDVEVRIQINDGFHIGKDVWTTLGELVDSSGRTFIRR
jgi:hypothetical protein